MVEGGTVAWLRAAALLCCTVGYLPSESSWVVVVKNTSYTPTLYSLDLANEYGTLCQY